MLQFVMRLGENSMGVYAVTGGTKGIGFDAVKALSGWGHDVINIDIDNGDICADLGTQRGRRTVIDELHDRCVDGLDGFISNAGIVWRKAFHGTFLEVISEQSP